MPPENQSAVKITTADGTDVTEVVRQTYDMATSSMDYGSGFLSTEEMQALLDLGRILGADDVLDVQAKLARMKFPDGRFGPEHEFQPDREAPIEKEACCLVCGQIARAWPYLHGLDVYPPEDREKVAQQIQDEKGWSENRRTFPVIAPFRPPDLVGPPAEWEREVSEDGTVIIRVTAAGVLPDTVLPHRKSKAVEVGDVIQFQADSAVLLQEEDDDHGPASPPVGGEEAMDWTPECLCGAPWPHSKEAL